MKLKNKIFDYEVDYRDHDYYAVEIDDEEIDLDVTTQCYIKPYDKDNYITLKIPFWIGCEAGDFPHSDKKTKKIKKKIAEKLNIPLIRKYDYEGSNYHNRDIILDSYNAITYCSKSNTIKNQDDLTSTQILDAVDYRMTPNIKEYFMIDARYLFTNGIDASVSYIISEDDVEDKKFYKHLLSKTHEVVVAPTINSLRGFRGYDKRNGNPDPSGDDKWWEDGKTEYVKLTVADDN